MFSGLTWLDEEWREVDLDEIKTVQKEGSQIQPTPNFKGRFYPLSVI